MKRKQRKQLRRTINLVIGGAAVAVTGAAVLEQLRLPPEARTWQGKIIGIPYNFTRPAIEDMRKAMWNEETDAILVPRRFGVGWDINLYPLLHR
jgi:hypothetical protein